MRVTVKREKTYERGRTYKRELERTSGRAAVQPGAEGLPAEPGAVSNETWRALVDESGNAMKPQQRTVV